MTTRRQALKITAVAGLSLAFGGSVAMGLLRMAGLRRASATRTRMGTSVTVTVIHPEDGSARALVEAAFTEMERLESILSRHRAGTAVDRLNREGFLSGAPDELLTVLSTSTNISELTGGAFDTTIAPVLDLYASRTAAGGMPSQREVESARSLVDYRELELRGRDVRLGRPGMSITLDGVAKGYIVDQTSAVLLRRGAERVMVEAGGDAASAGQAALPERWRLAVRDPRDPAGLLGIVYIDGQGVATSGDYIQSFRDDYSLHHILDPRTGRSPERLSQVTVVAPTAMEADALSTAVLVLGTDEGSALIESLDRVEGLIVTKDGERLSSGGFDRYLS